jgi:hypothetical protein
LSIYWFILALPALFSLSPIRASRNLKTIAFWLFGIFLVFLIGWRHEIGGDWFRYLDTAYGIQKGGDFDFSSFYTGDYAYRLVHWISVNHLNGIYATNLICAIFFVAGLIRFSRAMSIPWMALFVSIQFLVIVVSMGYTRQAAALGFLLWGLVDLINGKNIRFYVLIFVGSLFHFTSLIMLPIGLMYSLKNNNTQIVFLLLATSLSGFLVYILFLDSIDHMVYHYLTIKFHHSDGAIVRVFMNFFAAVLFFIFYKKYKEIFNDGKLWVIFSIVSIVLLPITFQYSTFIDRIAIYFLPIQLVVFSRIPVLIGSPYNRTIFILGAILIYFSALFVWLNFGNFSSYWTPYQNILMKI